MVLSVLAQVVRKVSPAASNAHHDPFAFTDEASARNGEMQAPPEDVRMELEYAMQEARPEDRAAIADEIAMFDRFGISAGALDSVYASKAMRASYHRTNRKRGRRH